jgi:ring-1,2-phenylacetyl-CoA epoxidase subunit PaaE
MGFFSRKKKEENSTPITTSPKGFFELEVKEIKKLTPESVQVSFKISDELKSTFNFIPGQYLNLSSIIGGLEERRSYSICSGVDEDLAVAIKRINNGKFSNWANDILKVGDLVKVAAPLGNFKLDENSRNIVAYAAGSGITPIISMAKKLAKNGGKLNLFYGNRSLNSIMFKSEFDSLSNVAVTHYLSGEKIEDQREGRLDKDAISAIIKEDLALLKADGFYLCGPETMIKSAIDTLTLFGVPKSKIHYELYTTPVLLIEESAVENINFEGDSRIKVLLDEEEFEIKLNSSGKTILDAINKEGYDAPYSCRGGVCCTCKAKVLKGKVNMNLNYSLTDQEVADGYILTCQAHPASEEVTISYDA